MKLDGPAALIVYLCLMAAVGVVALGVWLLATGELHVHNGYDDPIVVQAGDHDERLDAHSSVSLGKHLRGELVVTALDPITRRTIDEIKVTIKPFGADDVVVNPGGRAAFVQYEQEYVEDPEDTDVESLGEPLWFYGRIIELEDIDYVLTETPDEVSLGSGQRRVVKTALEAVDRFSSLVDLDTLYADIAPEIHLGMATAALRRAPVHEGAWRVTGRYMPPDERLALMTEIRSADPDDYAAHLRYLDAGTDAGLTDEALTEEYEAWLAQEPDDIDRKVLLALARREWGDVLLDAVETQPDHPANYPLGIQALLAEDVEDAHEHFERYAALGPNERAESAHKRLRLRRAMGQAWSPDQDAELRLDRGFELEMHGLLLAWRAESKPQELDAAIRTGRERLMLRHAVERDSAEWMQERDNALAAVAAGQVDVAQTYAADRADEDLAILLALATGEGLDSLLDGLGSDVDQVWALPVAAAMARQEGHPRADELSVLVAPYYPCLVPLLDDPAPPTAESVEQAAYWCDDDVRGMAWLVGWLRAPEHPAAAVWHAQARKWQWPGLTPARDRWPREGGAGAATD